MLRWVATVLLAFFLSGCASVPKTDWAARIGQYHFDEAVLELGPPDRQTQLSTGETVAEWVTVRRSRFSFGVGTGFTRGGVGVGLGQGITPGPDVRVLRLIFDEQGVLKEWKRL